ncbi:LacI family transcriptional regulator, partial [bacterium]
MSCCDLQMVRNANWAGMSSKISLTRPPVRRRRIRKSMSIHPEETSVKQLPERAKTATLQDVAKVAGVTAMTVSRVIKGSGKVAPATREMVLRVAQELNYTANLSARALKTGRTSVVAIISGSLSLPYTASIVSILESMLHSSGYQMRLLHTRGELRDLVNSTNAAAVDGVIVAGLHGLVAEFRSQNLTLLQPSVYIGITKLEDSDYVYSNLQPAVEEALETMFAAGRQRIAFAGIGVVGKTLSTSDPE